MSKCLILIGGERTGDQKEGVKICISQFQALQSPRSGPAKDSAARAAPLQPCGGLDGLRRAASALRMALWPSHGRFSQAQPCAGRAQGPAAQRRAAEGLRGPPRGRLSTAALSRAVQNRAALSRTAGNRACSGAPF
ncbi:hypothetical protein R1sor_010216 [Riccia sorocarpa]|uniref:Uncharacterized protein n=1 Tax=Riccia sorocarpa TaxID=122646 RepID=A0ABD3I1B4_9MARC